MSGNGGPSPRGREQRGRGGPGQRGRGRGRGAGRGANFGGSLSDLPSVPRGRETVKESEKGKVKRSGPSTDEVGETASQGNALASSLDTTTAIEGETCFICAEPVKLYSIPPCNHKTCHICAIRLRVLYKKQDCTFCKAPTENLIFTSQTEKEYLSFNAEEIPYKDERLKIYFETEQNRDETLVLLHFNCPDATCDYTGASWPDLKAHVKSEHGKLFCDLCVRNSRIFVHEHTLYTSNELTQHIRSGHKHCEFCKLNFYSDDELYIHMRDRHEQCFICKTHEETRDEYHRDYTALERHFKQRHYLCESKVCLEQKFVVFESEMDFKAHQVAEHGGELSSREKREALRVTANFDYHPNSSQARAEHGGPASTGFTPRGQRENVEGSSSSGRNNATTGANRDPLAVSALASRSYVPGAGGPANHQSRRAQFGSGLTSAQKIRESEEAAAHKAAEEERARQVQAFLGRVAEIVHHSEVKMHSFRTNLKTFQANEMSARDLIETVKGIVEDTSQVEEIVKGTVEATDSSEKKQDLLDAWTTVQVEQTHFPSLGGSAPGNGGSSSWGGGHSNFSTITRGQVRSIKNSSVAANSGIWANVERAAASGGSVYRNVARASGVSSSSTRTGMNNFPSLSSNKTVVPGSAVHSARANAGARAAAGGAAWSASGSGASSNGRSTPLPGVQRQAPAAVPKPFSVDVSRNAQRNNQTSVRSNSAAFPSLPINADAARLTAQKKALFEHKRSANNSGSATPGGTPSWQQSGIGRIDGPASGSTTPFGQPDLDTDDLHERLSGAAQIVDDGWGAGGGGGVGGKKGKQQKKVLMSMGGVHRG